MFRPSVGKLVRPCVVYLIVRPSVSPGLRLEDVSRGQRCILSKLVLFTEM